jgi:hypothetical protein
MADGLSSASNPSDREPCPPISWQPVARYTTSFKTVHRLATLPPQCPSQPDYFRTIATSACRYRTGFLARGISGRPTLVGGITQVPRYCAGAGRISPSGRGGSERLAASGGEVRRDNRGSPAKASALPGRQDNQSNGVGARRDSRRSRNQSSRAACRNLLHITRGRFRSGVNNGEFLLKEGVPKRKVDQSECDIEKECIACSPQTLATGHGESRPTE